jgi:arylsulfatase A-like enzyme
VIGRDMVESDLQTKIPRDMPEDELRRWAYQIYMKRYLACVAAVDENVGRLMDYLEKEGLADNTIVVYTSDQGFFLGEHGFFDKRLMYEPCLTTPLLVRYPGHTKPGSVSKDIVLNIDHAPTFLDILGQKVPSEMQGRSYRQILDGHTPADWRTSMYYRYWMHLDPSHLAPGCYGVRTKRYTLIHYYGKGLDMKGAKNIDKTPEWELFDLEKDPQEMHNVYSDPTYASTVTELHAELDRLRRELGDDK